MAANPELSVALVIGVKRFQAALLIERVAANTSLSASEEAALIERVWPSIEEANLAAPAHARVEKSLILVAAADRPLVRAGKGTIQRPISLALYKDDIDRLYASAEKAMVDDGVLDLPDSSDIYAIACIVREKALAVLSWPNLDDSTGFFDGGMDSLQALQLTRALQRALKRPDISLSTIYENSTVLELATAITQQAEKQVDDKHIMGSLLGTYRELIEQIPVSKSPTSQLSMNKGETIDVILTGSTGTLDTHLLHALLRRRVIGHIFCFNRAANGGLAAQSKAFRFNHLDAASFKVRVSFLSANLAHPSLGLKKTTYDMLCNRAHIIVHNAWLVNFNLGLLAFRPQLARLINLFTLAATSTSPMQVLFISSTSAAGNNVAEAILPENLDTPYAMGYARAKFIAELLCDAAARHLHLPVSVARLGQIAGPVRRPGIWTRVEWLPSLVIGSLEMGCVPDYLGNRFDVVDWVPSDMIGEIVIDIAVAPADADEGVLLGAKVFNVRGPHITCWRALLPAIKDIVSKALPGENQTEIEVVSPDIWLSQLGLELQSSSDVFKGNPALKLLDFYRHILRDEEQVTGPIDISRAMASSDTLRQLEIVGQVWMKKWVQEWLEVVSLE